MPGFIAFAASAVLLVPMGGAVSAPPFEACDSSVSMVFRRYVPEWCGTHDQKGYAQFRSAFTEYQALMLEVDDAFATSISEFNYWMCGNSAEAARNPLYFVVKPTLGDADAAVLTMRGLMKEALKGHPRESKITQAVSALRPNLALYQESRMRLESLADMWETLPTVDKDPNPCVAASKQLADESGKYVEAAQAKSALVRQISAALNLSDELCEGIEVTDPIPEKKIKKTGPPKTQKSGGASLTFPKTVDVGKKPKNLPVNVTSPQSSYGTLSLKRGSKGIVATGGWFEAGTSGLLMTVPGKTKTGKVTLTFALEGGPTVKAKVKLI